MVDVIDDQRSFTVTRMAPEGDVQILSFNSISEAMPGSAVDFCWGQIRNDGGADTCFVSLVDDTGSQFGRWSGVLTAGQTYDYLFQGTMPDRDLVLTLRAGHNE